MPHSEEFFNGGLGPNPNSDRTMAARGRTRGLGRNRASIRIVEDGQPNDSLSRNRDDIPNIRATHRPYHHIRKHGTSVSHSRRTRQDRFVFTGLKYNPPIAPRAFFVPSGPAAKRHSIPSLDELAPRKRRRTESPPPTAPNTHTHPTSSAPANHEHLFPRVTTGPRSRAIVAEVAVECEPSLLEFPVNAKRESSPIVIDTLGCPPSPPLFEKLGLPEKTSGSYHVAMIDECKKGAISYRERRQEWKDDILNAVRFVRGHDFPPLTIERCFIRSDGASIDWSVPNEATPTNDASNGSGGTTTPAPALHASVARSPVVDKVTPPPIRRLAPLPTSAPTHPVHTSNLDKVPVASTESSTRSSTRILPKGIAKDALPVEVIDVPEYLLGESMKKDRYDWRNRVIIELGNPNYKGVFAPTREKGPEGKWRVAGLELHIYDTGEENPPALPKEIHRGLLKEKVIDPTRNTNQATQETSVPAEINSIDTPIPAEQTKTSIGWGDTLSGSRAHQRSSLSALAPQRSIDLESTTDHTRERNSAHQPAPPFHAFSSIGASASVVQSKQRSSNRKESQRSSPSIPIAHLPRTVAPMRPPRGTLHLEELVLLSADISALSPSHSPVPHIIKSEPEPEPMLVPSSGPLPEMVLPQSPPRTTEQSEPTQSLPGIQFDSSFCSGSNTVESLSDVAKGFLRRFFGYLESAEKARISGGYSEAAVMSWQLNSLPSVGVCPQVGNPQAQGHQITEVPRWFERNQLLQGHRTRRLVCGKDDIVKRLESMADLIMAPSPDRDPEYEYEALDLGIGGLVQVRCWGYLHKMVDDESHIALRFERTFILEKNHGAAKFIWPWVVLNDQMTFFHRPGIVCQCLGGRRT